MNQLIHVRNCKHPLLSLDSKVSNTHDLEIKCICSHSSQHSVPDPNPHPKKMWKLRKMIEEGCDQSYAVELASPCDRNCVTNLIRVRGIARKWQNSQQEQQRAKIHIRVHLALPAALNNPQLEGNAEGNTKKHNKLLLPSIESKSWRIGEAERVKMNKTKQEP